MRRVDEALVRVSDSSGRQRGLAFPVDHQGTLLTSHETVDGQSALLLTWPGGAVRRVTADDVIALPEYDLALLRTDAVLPPLALGGGSGSAATRLVQLAGPTQTLQGGVVGPVTARYAAVERWHLVADSWLLELDQAPHGLPVELSGAPLLDAETGAVVAVATAALRSHRRGAVLAVPLRAAAGHPAVADLLARNAASVPAYGRALNLAGVLELTAATTSALTPLVGPRVERADAPPGDWSADRPVLAVLAEPGCGLTTELAALALRRARSATRQPTVWLRGADLHPHDASLFDAVERVLPDAERACRLAAAGHRPLLVVLDRPEEMPPSLQPDLAEWSAETGRQLRRTGARLLIGCRPEFWQQQRFSAEDVQPPHLLGDLPAEAAEELARRLGLRAGGCPAPRHPLALRLLAELPIPDAAPTRAELLEATVDFACLRIARRLAHPDRRTAAAAAGRVHEAARRMLGPGSGALTRADFDEVFPGVWGPAVLAEGLLVPAGPGYRFAHEELSEWLQGVHLDLPAALGALLGDTALPRQAVSHRRRGQRGTPVPPPPRAPVRGLPVPRHRIGPVREALLRVEQPEEQLSRLVLCLDGPEAAEPGSAPHWWALNLLSSVLLRLPDPVERLPLLRALAARMSAHPEPPLPLDFWTRLPLPTPVRIDLLRELARGGDPAPLDAVAAVLVADPAEALPALCGWLRDEQFAASAVHLLRGHRRVALDDLTEALVSAAHPRADALLRELAVIEPSALCRAVDRWAHDPRPERHVAAAVHAPAITPASGPDRSLLRFAAQALLARPAERELHGAALTLLVADPETRPRHLPDAVAGYAAAEPHLTPDSLAPALDSHTALVLAAYRARLHQPGEEAAAVLRTLGATPAPRARAATARLVAEYLAEHPEAAARVAAWLAARTRHGSAERATLLRFVHDLRDQPEAVRNAFAAALTGQDPVHGELLSALRQLEPVRGGDQPHGTL
ncbi:serine protease [Streptacidiphilus cavernicola]|uniref:Serine protease n=1 Tax=Streptacidiphilus cavernicola TaxID=3342716 RepID=A0ABV6W6A9_9ACTN